VLIESRRLLREPLYLFRSERLAGARGGHRIAVDGAVGRVGGRCR
jgi:hypothetical protein